MPLLEANQYGAWIGKQTAKGSPNNAPARRLQMVGGNMGATRDDGEENYSDLTKYGARVDWVNSLTGAAEPVCHATPVETAYLLWLLHGAEAVTAVAGAAGPPAVPAMSRHRFTPAGTMGHYCTAFLRVGAGVIRRHQFNDCVVTRAVIEASSANKAARITPRILSLDPAQVYGPSDPAAALPVDRPFLFTDFGQVAGAAAPTIDGSLTMGGTVYRGITQYTFTIDDAWEPIYGDSPVPYDFNQGTPTVSVGCTIYADAAGVAKYNALWYGTPTPAAGARPIKSIPALDSFEGLMRQRDSAGAHAGRELRTALPGVKWAPPEAPAPNPDGGVTEIPLAGTMRPVAGQPAYTVDVLTDAATTAFVA